MFNEKEITAYQAIKAPDGMREKILAAESAEKTVNISQFKRILSAAACLVIIIASVMMFGRNGGMEIYIGGQKLTNTIQLSNGEDAITPAAYRMVQPLSVTLQLESDGETLITVSDGKVINAEGEEITSVCDACKTVTWIIENPDTNNVYTLKIQHGRKQIEAQLEYDDASGNWSASKIR